MVLSSQTTMGLARHQFQTDVAACWGNLARAAATGAPGCNSWVLPNPLRSVGRHGNGNTVTCATLSSRNHGVGRWERCNISPTGGRQHVSDDVSSNGWIHGDVVYQKGVCGTGCGNVSRSANSSSLSWRSVRTLWGGRCKWSEPKGHFRAIERYGMRAAG